MPEIKLTVIHEVGFHARPASIYIQTAAKFSSDIEVRHRETSANAKSILEVLPLGAHNGAEIIIKAEGDDAEKALQAFEELVLSYFGEN